jgi:hypothetical protein
MAVSAIATPAFMSRVPARHGFEGAERPDGVNVAEEENSAGIGSLAFRTETGFNDVPKLPLPVDFDAAAQGPCVFQNQIPACIYCLFLVRRGLNSHYFLDKIDQF